MASGVYAWSQTAATNATADSAINFAEGQAPSSVNDSARALMASVAKWRDDNAGSLTTGGTSTAFTVSTSQGFSSLATMAGQTIRLTFNATCGASPTLNVDGLGAKAITYANGSAVGAGDLVSGSVYAFVYDNSNTIWVMHGAGKSGIPAGTLMLFQQTAAPTGWTKQTTHNDKALRVVSGPASSGGSTAFTSIFAARTITQGNLPNYTLPSTYGLTDPGHSHGYSVPNSLTLVAGGGNGVWAAAVSASVTGASATGISLSGSVTSGGSGTAMDFAVQYVDLIIAAKN